MRPRQESGNKQAQLRKEEYQLELLLLEVESKAGKCLQALTVNGNAAKVMKLLLKSGFYRWYTWVTCHTASHPLFSLGSPASSSSLQYQKPKTLPLDIMTWFLA